MAITTISSSEHITRIFGGLPEISTPSFAGGFAGIVFFYAAAASSLDQEVHANEMAHKFNPKEVVLYQYEACPFCNKVKDAEEEAARGRWKQELHEENKLTRSAVMVTSGVNQAFVNIFVSHSLSPNRFPKL
ncbi:PREDICTED: uncharacterized protein LOC109132899 [Camelina sativa]|uniref:Uncharacterized protein LOC109132899 n=1 Tax=Camelina sativa TaxID=90675 RepID=A0ABM1RPH1_CAMSA|nr:PREDICTED: uncharacterized protein LOC109132899 [Camelina sativa]